MLGTGYEDWAMCWARKPNLFFLFFFFEENNITIDALGLEEAKKRPECRSHTGEQTPKVVLNLIFQFVFLISDATYKFHLF